MLKGGSQKLMKSNLTYQLQTFTKHLTVDDNNNNAYWAEILAETWAIIGEFDNFSQIQVSKCNFGPITELQCHNA